MSASASRRLFLACVTITTACTLGLASCADLTGLDTGPADASPDHAVTPDATAGDAAPGADAAAQSEAQAEAAADAGSALDATTEAEADAARDASVEASSPDAADGAVDASKLGDASMDAADGEAGTWCSQQSPTPTFCADFDTPPLAAGWTGTNQTNGTVSLDTTRFVTGPSSLLATTSAFTASGMAQSVLYKTLTPSGPTVHLELQLSIAAIDLHAQVVGAELVVLSPSNTDLYRYSLVITATGSEIQEEYAGDSGNLYKTTQLGTVFTVGTFYPVQIDLVLPTPGGAAPSGTLHIGGKLLLDHVPLFDGAAQGNLQIDVGAQVYPSVAIGSCQTNADNVLLNVGP